MGTYNLLRFPDADELAQAVAREWAAKLEGTSDAPFSVALSGGRIARRLFSAAAMEFRARPSRLNIMEFFWGDERCVPPGDPESNYAIARELLFSPLELPEERIHRIPGEKPPKVAVKEATAEFSRIVPSRDDTPPVLSLVFLGMGEDGHVASLFPGESEALMQSPDVYRAVVAAKPPPQRVTLGYSTIAAAREVWVLASGAGKEGTLRESLSPTGTTPLARVLKLRATTRVFSDIRI